MVEADDIVTSIKLSHLPTQQLRLVFQAHDQNAYANLIFCQSILLIRAKQQRKRIDMTDGAKEI